MEALSVTGTLKESVQKQKELKIILQWEYELAPKAYFLFNSFPKFESCSLILFP